MLYNAWSRLIRALRRRRELSQPAAAARAGVGVMTWWRWEKGEVPPRPCHLEAIAGALGRSPQQLGLEYATLLYRHYLKQTKVEAAAAHRSGCPGPAKREPERPAPTPKTARERSTRKEKGVTHVPTDYL